MTNRIERCCLCDEPTGRAGKYDDSIFIDLPNCTLGPLCETCMHGLEDWCADNTGSAAELAAMTERAEKAERERDRVLARMVDTMSRMIASRHIDGYQVYTEVAEDYRKDAEAELGKEPKDA